MSTSRKEEIIKKGFLKSLIDGTLEIKDLAGINIDLDIARQAYLQGVQETTQALIEAVEANMATVEGQALQATGAKQDLLKGVMDDVKLGTDKIIADAATAAGQALQATAAKQDTMKTAIDGVKTGTNKIIANAATAAKQDLQATVAYQSAIYNRQNLQATSAKQDSQATSAKQDSMKTAIDGVKVGTDKIIANAATAAKQDLQATAAKQNLQATAAKQDLMKNVLDSIDDKTGITAIVTPSNDILLSSDGVVSDESDAWVKLKEFLITIVGIYRISFEFKSQSPDSGIYGRIYKDGVGFGTQQNTVPTHSTYQIRTEELSFDAGELCQLYLKSDPTAGFAYARYFRLKGIIYVGAGVEQ